MTMLLDLHAFVFQSAERCCHDQTSSSLTSPASNGSDVGDGDAGGGCPMTWDGFSCVNRTPAGQTAVIACPTFIKRFNSDIIGEPRHDHFVSELLLGYWVVQGLLTLLTVSRRRLSPLAVFTSFR